jgi:outer membrane protein assembly factor BamA
VSGLAQLSITDVLGNHQATVATSLNFSLKDSDFFASYAYLKRRTHYAGILYHTRYFFLTNSQLAADRLYGLNLQMERPFNKFSRVETGVQLLNISREIIDNRYQSPFIRGGFFAGTTRGLSGQSLPTRRAYTTSLALVNDNTLAGYFGPVDGSRTRLGFERSWQGLTYNTTELDTRHYFRVLRDYTFAFRLAGGVSYGRNRQVFFLGGVNNEINPRFATNSRLNDLNSDEVFFSKFVWPLRGLDLFEQSGDTYLLSNIEFRFPIVRQLQLGWPLPFLFQDVEGDLFLDIGGAFDRAHFDPWDARDGGLILNGFNPRKRGGFAAGYGLGIRVNVGIFLFRYDLAWPTDLSRTYSPKQYFSADIQGLF